MIKMPNPTSKRNFATRTIRLASAGLLGAVLLCSSPAFAVNKEMVQLQTQVQQLQDAVARLQQSNDERMRVMKDLITQSADAVNKMSINMQTLQTQIKTHQALHNRTLD